MAQRKRNKGLFDILFELPWWASLILGVILLCINAQNNAAVTLVFRGLALICFAASVAGAIRSLTRKLLFASAKDIDAIRAMSWREFERLVGEAYRRQGYMVEETGGGGSDGGIDLLLRGKGQKVIVQCKQWKIFKVGVKIVREMYGIMVAERADRVIIVASGTYTQEAQSFARGKPIALIDGKALVQLIRDVRGEPAAAFAQPAQAAPQKVLHVQTSGSADIAPSCPKCGASMVLRTARKGAHVGGQFWGCPKYPACNGIVNV